MTQLWEPVGDTGTDVERVRTAYEALHAQFSPPPEAAIRSVNTGGVASLLVAGQLEASATLPYLHGGGYVAGSAFGYRHLAGALGTAAETGVLLPEYRLAPEHPFPAAIEDALSAYLWIIDSGVNPQRVTLAGDSAGAHLALSLLITIRQQQLPLPGRAVLLCPWADLANIRAQTHGEPQPVATPEQQRRWMNSYLAGYPHDDAVVSPLTADLTGFPPMLIQAGTGDPSLRTHTCSPTMPAATTWTSGSSSTRSQPTTSTSSGPSSPKPPTPYTRPGVSSAIPPQGKPPCRRHPAPAPAADPSVNVFAAAIGASGLEKGA